MVAKKTKVGKAVTVYPNYSVSQINMYLQCPRKYEFRYVMGLPSSSSDSLVFGNSIHSAMERNFKQKIFSRQDLRPKKLIDTFAEEMEDSKDKVEWMSGYGESIDIGAELIKIYLEDYSRKIQPLSSEQEFLLKVKGISKPLKGFIDLVFNNYTLLDFKTIKKTPSDMDVRKNLFQLSGYTYAIKELAKDPEGMFTEKQRKELKRLSRIPARLDFFVKLKKPKIIVRTFNRDKIDVARFKFIAKSVTDAIEKSAFPPNFGSFLCSEKYCAYYSICNKSIGEDSFMTNKR